MDAKRVESPAEKPSASAVEGEMRDLVRGVAAARKAAETNTETADGVLPVIARIAAASLEEIDKLIRDLQDSRNYLKAEADRIQREAARYSELSDNALQAAKIITQHLNGWRKPEAVQEAPAAT